MEVAMPTRRLILAAGLASLIMASPALAQTPVKVVATFSILADLARNVGGDRVAVTSLVAPDGDAHVYAPTPNDAKKLSDAQLVLANGLGFEGWIARLVKSSTTKAPTVTASTGIKPLKATDSHGHGGSDPHAWQSVANAKIYVGNIRDGLVKVDPAGRATYEANATAYLAKLDALDAEVKAAVAKIPAERRRIITTHDAFGYFGSTYGLTFIAPAGVSTESEASAKDVARIITQIKKQKIPAVFLENVSDPRLMQQIAKESGARVGGKLYSDALSAPGGQASTYLDMMRSNVREFSTALTM
jgi:zinc/manganese transport system substrate-binding protein